MFTLLICCGNNDTKINYHSVTKHKIVGWNVSQCYVSSSASASSHVFSRSQLVIWILRCITTHPTCWSLSMLSSILASTSWKSSTNRELVAIWITDTDQTQTTHFLIPEAVQQSPQVSTMKTDHLLCLAKVKTSAETQDIQQTSLTMIKT